MARKASARKPAPASTHRPSALIDTRVIYCGDNLEQLAKLPEGCIDLIYIDPPFNSNRNYESLLGPLIRAAPVRKRASSRLRRPPCQHAGVHRHHAAALRGTGPRRQENRLLLLPLRLARQPPVA
jgi:hypothetical protein